MSPAASRWLEHQARFKGRPWRWSLAVVGWVTVLLGVAQLFIPGPELRLLHANASAAPVHFFRFMGMFLVLFGCMLLHGLHEPRENQAAFLWSGLQKVGSCVLVLIAVARGLMSPLGLSLAAFDAVAAVLALGFYASLRQREQIITVLKPRAEVAPPELAGPSVNALRVAEAARGEVLPPRPPPAVSASAPGQTSPVEAPRRSLVLSGGGIRVAWQAGVVRALTDARLSFAHVDGTSGGIITLAMWLSGLSPAQMCERWRTLDVKDFVSLMPLDECSRPWGLAAVGDADGVTQRVFPHLGVDVEAIRANRERSGTFNVCDFTRKTNEAIPHTDVDRDLLVAGLSPPLILPPVARDGHLFLDSVWIQDANVMEAVRRGADEIWVAWCIGNTPRYHHGFFRQYVHMIELSANGALFAQLEQVRELNARILAGEQVPGHARPITVHLIKPEHPLPLDPEVYAGRVTAATLVDQGYSDACRYLAVADAQGLPLTPEITQMTEPANDLSFRETMAGPLAMGATDPEAGAHDGRSTPFTMHCTITIDDMEAFIRDANHAARLVAHVQYKPLGFDIPVREGSFNLFRATDDPRTKIMTYGLRFQAHGQDYYLDGTKTLRDDPGPDLWRDTTRLYSYLHQGVDARGPVVGAGVLVLGMRELIRLVSSMRSSRGGVEGAEVMARFGHLFLGALWDLYAAEAPIHERGGEAAHEHDR
ncbi:patatin-like phospholipase family protein [Corallococcus sp. EGB]|uniref:patatin-like phospholipase family protein n=1 Tax=Corallococcus sp. EGB TaxID=1521117 RepID=UPI001CBAD753|nr:patatin-like phospholipase family protein [Corallococcus sp. EGB]